MGALPVARRVLVALGVVVLLAGCGGGPPSDNKDPRKGRVWSSWSNCLWGSCTADWKICIGPDLLVSIDGDKHTAKNSEECHVQP